MGYDKDGKEYFASSYGDLRNHAVADRAIQDQAVSDRAMSTSAESLKLPSRTRTEGAGNQKTLCACAWSGCNALFEQRFPEQRFCKAKCRAAYSREVGLVGEVVGVRRLARRISVIVHCQDERALDLLLKSRVRLVREPCS